MAKKQSAFFEQTEDFEDLLDERLEQLDEDEVPDDDYEPEVPPEPEQKRQGRPMITREIRVDTLTVIRKRVPLTKSMCRKQGCKFDAAPEMGTRQDGRTPLYSEWKRVPPERRAECLALLERHVKFAHSASDSHIVFESDMQKEWLGVNVHTGKARK